jgi:hypothetical protein
MSNDPRDLQGEKLQKALQLFGRDENLRKELIVMLMQAEKRINYSDGSIREDITGPIVDALHTEEDSVFI